MGLEAMFDSLFEVPHQSEGEVGLEAMFDSLCEVPHQSG